MAKLTKRQRIKLARDLTEATTQPDWYETDPPEVLAQKRYAVICERPDESWIDSVDTLQDVADIAHGCVYGPEYEVEWIGGVTDLETGEPVAYKQTVIVVLHHTDAEGVESVYSSAG